jgi:esterase FrsA
MTLPAHEHNLSPHDAIGAWAEEFASGIDPLAPFFDAFETALSFVIQEGLSIPGRIAVGGLSRGGLIAIHAIGRSEALSSLFAFAPMTSLQGAREFAHLQSNSLVATYDAASQAKNIGNRPVWIHMGLSDTRVSADDAFDFAKTLAARGNKHVEIHFIPSIGHMGHGTSPETFAKGAEWISAMLKA